MNSSIFGSLIALVLGALVPAGFAPLGWWVVSLVSLAGFVMLLQEGSAWRCFSRALFFGIGMFATGVSWVYVSIHVHGHTSALIAGGLTAGFVLLLALLFAIPFLLLGLTHSRNTTSLLFGFPSIWVLTELLRSWIFTGFPWLLVGNAFIDTWFKGWAPVAGVYGISWIVAFTAVLLACLPRWKADKNKLEVAIFLVVVFCISGSYMARKPWTNPSTTTLSIGLVQPAVPLKQKWNRDELVGIIQGLESLNNKVLDNDLIVWPESAIPAFRKDVAPYLATLSAKALENQVGIIMGIPTTNHAGDRFYNSVIGLGFAEGEYSKQHLVPFGEYVPLENVLRGLIGFFDLPMSAFSAGSDQQQLITYKGLQIGTAICYEIAYPNLVRQVAGKADILVTVSNDAWFGGTIGPDQHLQIARMRALENGKPLIRATNDGLTAIIDQKGRIRGTIPQYQPGVLEGSLVPHKGQTPYNKYGNTPLLIVMLLMLLITAGVKSGEVGHESRGKR